MFESFIHAAKQSADDTLKRAVGGTVAALLGAVALFFFTLGAYDWAQGELGAIAAACCIGGVYLVVAVVTFALTRARRRVEDAQLGVLETPAARAEPELQAILGPVVLKAVTEILSFVKSRNLVPALALSAVLLAALQRPQKKAQR